MRLLEVAVTAEALEAVLCFDAGEPLRTSEVPGLPDHVVAALPGLKGHRCDNGAGATFADELRDTEIAHAVEHAALEIMATAGSPDTLRGATSWDFARDGRGVFRIRLEYDDRAVALGALAFAVRLVEATLSGEGLPDALAEARHLRSGRDAASAGARRGSDAAQTVYGNDRIDGSGR